MIIWSLRWRETAPGLPDSPAGVICVCFYCFEQLHLVTEGPPSIHHQVLMGSDLPQGPLQLPHSFPEILFTFSLIPLFLFFLGLFSFPSLVELLAHLWHQLP